MDFIAFAAPAITCEICLRGCEMLFLEEKTYTPDYKSVNLSLI